MSVALIELIMYIRLCVPLFFLVPLTHVDPLHIQTQVARAPWRHSIEANTNLRVPGTWCGLLPY